MNSRTSWLLSLVVALCASVALAPTARAQSGAANGAGNANTPANAAAPAPEAAKKPASPWFHAAQPSAGAGQRTLVDNDAENDKALAALRAEILSGQAQLAGGGRAELATDAQSDILLRLRSGSPLGDRFRVDSASGFVAKGVLGIGIIPFTGAGERLMWHPYKAAFRAGSIGSAGTQWDDPNTGFYSWAGGYNTTALGLSSFAIGYQSQALGSYAVGMGYTANADGTGAVSIGYRTTADADYSVAIGQRASTNGHAGAIVFSDGSTTDSTQASANNQFTVRAAGGMRFFTNATMTTGVQVAAGGSSWAVISDRNRKEHFLTLNGEDVLAKLRNVPVTRWQYKDEEDRTTWHVGPMAQDWHAAFQLTTDDHTINMSDFDGVNLAAVKALDARTLELQQENAALRAENAATKAKLARMAEAQEELLARLERLERASAKPAGSHRR